MLDLSLAFLPFALSTSVTPGPNNAMLAVSGANFGLRRTWPHILGIVVGFPAMFIAAGLGLGAVLVELPLAHQVLQYVGAAYMLYLAWRIATAAPGASSEGTGRPLTFVEAAAFQWVNPKAWIMALGAISTFTSVGGQIVEEVLLLGSVFAIISLPTTVLWACFGMIVGRLLGTTRTALQAFNLVMAALIALSVLSILI
jgi:threonine/homoserine/homoserine lactone efflux protein